LTDPRKKKAALAVMIQKPLCWSLLLLAAALLAASALVDPGQARQVKPAAKRELVNSVGMKLVLIPAGKFKMGSGKDEKERFDDEGPVREVQITRAFYLGAYEVTQGQYAKVTGRYPSYFSEDGRGKDKVKGLDTSKLPLENVSWEQAVAFCKELSERAEEKKAGRVYRLPTEAEWEYACRAGTSTPFHFGKSLSSTQANFQGDYPYGTAKKGPTLDRPAAVGSYKPNAWGLYDMHGNVMEWCADRYDDDYYDMGERKDPKGPESGKDRVLRGGSWNDHARNCRSAYRFRASPRNRYINIGFRVACLLAGKGR
jgi:formylglycine-generating enzyme required for sulfatase activity